MFPFIHQEEPSKRSLAGLPLLGSTHPVAWAALSAATESWIKTAATVKGGHAETWFFHGNADIDRFLAVSDGVRGDLRSQEVRCIRVDLDIEALQGLREKQPSLRRRRWAGTKLL